MKRERGGREPHVSTAQADLQVGDDHIAAHQEEQADDYARSADTDRQRAQRRHQQWGEHPQRST